MHSCLGSIKRYFLFDRVYASMDLFLFCLEAWVWVDDLCVEYGM